MVENRCNRKILSKKASKCVRLLSAVGVEHSFEPTRHLFVSNSGLVCGVHTNDVIEAFARFEGFEGVQVLHGKSFTFVRFASAEEASKARGVVNGTVLPGCGTPAVILFVIDPPKPGKVGAAVPLPPGLVVTEEFVNSEVEQNLVNFLDQLKPQFANLKHRSVLHFGYVFDYDSNDAKTPAEPIPPPLKVLVERLVDEGVFSASAPPDQVTVNWYARGQGIPMHVDTHSAFEEPLASLSLRSAISIDFRHCANSASCQEVFLPSRSLMVMTREARYCYLHGIRQRNTDVDPQTGISFLREDRISVTFRRVRREPCACPFEEYCDWERGVTGVPSSDEDARRVERRFVQGVYDEIAPHFDLTRHSRWPIVVNFIASLPDYSLIVDAGCGNGKYLDWGNKHAVIGFDACENLINAASSKAPGLVAVASIFDAPLRAASADAVLCIAVIHHFATLSRRQRALGQLARLLRPGGRACVTVWSLDQTADGEASAYAKMRAGKSEESSAAPNRLAIHDGTAFTQQDMLVPWQRNTDGAQLFRYYHLYEPGELDAEVLGCGLDVRIVSSAYEQGNYVVVFERAS